MNIGQEADKYEPAKIKNIADLEVVPLNLEVHEEADVEYPYKFVMVDGERYKVPVSVLAALKEIRAENPKLTSFKVRKTGEGLKVKYLVIPLN